MNREMQRERDLETEKRSKGKADRMGETACFTGKMSLEQQAVAVLALMRRTLGAIEKLSRERSRNKMSNNRAVSVGKEMKELIKVMSAYVCR